MKQLEIPYNTLTSAGGKLDLSDAVAKAAQASSRAIHSVDLEIALLTQPSVVVNILDDGSASCTFNYDQLTHTVPLIASPEALDAIVRAYEIAALEVPHRSKYAAGGLYIIMGGASSGKTRWMSEHVERIWYAGEPDHRAISFQEARGRIRKLARLGLSQPTVLGIDSFKDAVYDSSGAAMSGGVSSGFLLELGELSRQLAGSNLYVIAVVNPVQEKLLEQLYESIAGATTGVIWLDKGMIKKGSERVWNHEGQFYERRNINQESVFHFMAAGQLREQTQMPSDRSDAITRTTVNQSTVREVAQLIAKQTGVL